MHDRRTFGGGALAGLLGLWLTGRVAMAAQSSLSPGVVAALGLAFPVALLVTVARPVIASKSWRNLGIVAVLGLLTACDAFIHLRFAAGDAMGGRTLLLAAVHFVVLLNVVVGGRVIGMFTWVATGRGKVRQRPLLNGVAIGATAGVALSVAAGHSGPGFAGCLALAGAANLLRMTQWTVREVFRIPMVLVLHVGYAWIGIGQLLLAAAHAGLPVAETTALHALTIGVIGTMTLGMMVRVSLGHTGRPMAPSPLVRIAFALMFAAPLARLSSLLLPSSAWNLTVQLAGALFAAAFLLFLVAFTPILLAPRADGRPD
ncbi:MAG: NnrS family protein [Planctomycetota bacterium]|nr:NnrS family protein [Planctomycetota bacterium]